MASSSTSGGHAFDQIIPLASASVTSSSRTKHMPYQVFINHCGQDVKETLASRIYNSLEGTGVRVFLDKTELNHGDFFPLAIEAAMRSASFHIAIFSEHYAQSPWCLAELAFMIEIGETIVPVFYHVEPFDLRWAIKGKGKYADALSEHESKGRIASEELHRWKMALHRVSFCHGYIIKNTE
ncbi:hypothetical protein SUGI_0683150 [Cryptomeria japonica]|nr:hypothetical protein SUGI_0683150 [Cryptomeria japonica]